MYPVFIVNKDENGGCALQSVPTYGTESITISGHNFVCINLAFRMEVAWFFLELLVASHFCLSH